MKYTTALTGKEYILRLEDGEIVQDSIEHFARTMGISSARIQMLGGIDKGSRIIVGPKEGRAETIEPVVHVLDEMYEVVGNGTIFCNEQGVPKLHCHLACGRGTRTLCGEIREGVIVWHVMEVIITELKKCDALRKHDPVTGFELLLPENEFIRR